MPSRTQPNRDPVCVSCFFAALFSLVFKIRTERADDLRVVSLFQTTANVFAHRSRDAVYHSTDRGVDPLKSMQKLCATGGGLSCAAACQVCEGRLIHLCISDMPSGDVKGSVIHLQIGEPYAHTHVTVRVSMWKHRTAQLSIQSYIFCHNICVSNMGTIRDCV